MPNDRSCLAGLFALSSILMAQSTGLVIGVAEDASGAVMPGVAVTAINELTGLRWAAQSDEAGRFNFPRLPVGAYRVEAVREGFRKFVSDSFRLDADQSRQVSVRLELGQATESITVSGTVSQVETVGGTLKEVVDEKRITELPLNGRNPVQLLLLVPGVVAGPGASSLNQNVALAVNGARAISNNYLLDGGDNNDVQQNVPAIVPNPDALEEFSVLTNNFSAEYGRNMGGIVNAVTKSGTNRFHGSLFEFVRNDRLDARSFFALGKGKLRRNQFGGSLGGPIVSNRTFFFLSYEGTRERRGETFSRLVVPSQAERNGDFSASVRKPNDPRTGQRFPGDRIPASRFDPASVNFLRELIPLPNTPDLRHIFNRPQNANRDQGMARVDHSLTANQRITGRIFKNNDSGLSTWGVPILQSSADFDNWNVQGQHTWTISPSLLAVGKYTFSRTEIDRGPLPAKGGSGDISYQSLGVKVNRGAPDSQIKLVPQFRGSVSGLWDLQQDNMVVIDRRTQQATYDLSYTRGAHMLKFGGEYRYSLSDRITANQADPQFAFTGQFSTSPFGDFLLGLPANFSQGSLRLNAIRNFTVGLYVQDDWKVRPNLTLSLGLRLEPFFPFYSRDDELTVFRPGRQSRMFPTAPAGLLYANDPGVPRGGAPADWNNLAPRVSLAWSPFRHNRTSVRVAYGLFYDTPPFHALSQFVTTAPYSMQVRVNAPRSFSDPYGGIVNPFPYVTPSTAEERARVRYLLPVLLSLSIDSELVAAYNQQWNVNVQQQLAGDFLVSVAYVGSKATRLPIQPNLNPALFRPGATLANVNARRIYPDFTDITNYQSSAFSTYNAGQFLLQKRFARGYTVLAHYTVGKTIDLSATEGSGFQDQRNLVLDKALSDLDVRQRFVTSFLWELPSPRAGIRKWVLGGWQTNGIFTIQSGRAFSVTSGIDRALSGTGSQRPNLVGIPVLDTGRSRGELIQRYFNPAAFALPAVGSFGDAGRNIMIGPGGYNLDFALFKTFSFRENNELQFRWEMFNAFNHANLENPVANIGAAAVGRIQGTSDPRIMQLGLRWTF